MDEKEPVIVVFVLFIFSRQAGARDGFNLFAAQLFSLVDCLQLTLMHSMEETVPTDVTHLADNRASA